MRMDVFCGAFDTIIDFKQATLYILDGTTPANSLEVVFGEGNFSWSEKKNYEYKPNRGVLNDVVEGDQVPMDVRFEADWLYATANSTGGTPTIEDALKQRGAAAGWVSSDSEVCRPYAVDLKLVYIPACATGDQEVFLFPDFRYEDKGSDLRGRQITISGRCNATEPTVTRSAQT